MAAQGQNEGFHVLDDFVCEAIHTPSIPIADHKSYGQNEGMRMVDELWFEAGRLESNSDQDAAIKSAIVPLAAYISASSNPHAALAKAMEALLTDLNVIDRSAMPLERSRLEGERSEVRANSEPPVQPYEQAT